MIGLDDRSDVGGRKRSVTVDIFMLVKGMWPFPE